MDTPGQLSTQTSSSRTKQYTISSTSTVSAFTPLTLLVETRNVETNMDVPHVETKPASTVNVETKNLSVNVETRESGQSTSHVETNTDIPLSPQFNVETPSDIRTEPTAATCIQVSHVTKTAKLVLEPLTDLDIDIWCKKTEDYYMYVPPTENSPNIVNSGYSLRDRKPKTTEKSVGVSLRRTSSVNYAPMLDSGSDEPDEPKRNKVNKVRPKPDGPSAAVRNAHEQIQNKRQKNFETKPVPKFPVRTPHSAVETPVSLGISVPVEMNVNNDSDTETYVNTESDTENRKPQNGTLVMKTVGIVRRKKKRKVRCKICGNSCKDVKGLNDHHRDKHDIVFCPDCNKAFSTRSSLDKHMYVHKSLDYVCDKCGKSYPFESRLNQHKITHRTVATHSCMFKNCGCSYKNTGDLNRHVNQHTGIWHYCDFCTYKNKDNRNTESHQRTHVSGNEKYICTCCSMKFKFNTQYRRHIASGCELPVKGPVRPMSPEY